MRRLRVGRYAWRVQFVGRDIWIGVFWKRHENSSPRGLDPVLTVYVCLVPCFPIIIERS